MRGRLGVLKRHGHAAALLGILLAGLMLRWWLIPRGGFIADIVLFKMWAEQLASMPLADFYRLANPSTDYLPGYLYLLAATERLRSQVDGPVSMLEPFFFWIKMAPILADLLLGLLVYQIAGRLVTQRRALIASALLVLNPGVVFTSAVWGQVDSVGMVLTMASLWALLGGRPALAALLGGAAFLTKPQYTLLLAVAGVAYYSSEIRRLPDFRSELARLSVARWAVRNLVLPGGALLVTLQLLLLPFSVTLWPGLSVAWTLRSRLVAAGTKFPVGSADAFNLWGTPIAGPWVPDSTMGWLSLSHQMWGYLFLGVAVALCALLAWTAGDDWGIVLWACFAASLAFFVLPTRIHERYLFSAIPPIAILAVRYRWAVPFFVAVSSLHLANIWYVYELHRTRYESANPFFASVASLFSVLLLILCIGIVAKLIVVKRRHLCASNLPGGFSP